MTKNTDVSVLNQRHSDRRVRISRVIHMAQGRHFHGLMDGSSYGWIDHDSEGQFVSSNT